MIRSSLAALSFLCTVTAAAGAQGHVHPSERLGTVHFPTSCAPAVAPRFDRAIALLHSFEFRAAIRGFEDVLASDSSCAMAWWGIALSRWLNPMTPNIRPAALLESGWQAAESGLRVAERAMATPREQDYLRAVAELYRDHPRRDQAARLQAYERAMADLAARHPSDVEAKIFHALAIVATASPADKSYANQLRAGAMLEELFRAQPDHPGLAHYIIHSYDYPPLAGRAAAAARRYADIAPAAAHALHMPSHTFTRVGLWEQSVATNRRSMDEAIRTGSIAEALHAADYMVYALLQMRRDSQALAILRALPPLAARFDPKAVTGAAPGSAGVFALAAMPARWALERRAWAEAAALAPARSDFPYTEALTYFARAWGQANTADTAGARRSIDSLRAIHGRLRDAGEAYWAEQVAIQQLAAEAWLHFASGRTDDALTAMRAAAAREDATEKAAVTPGPLAPAREQLGDMLLRLGRPAEALAEYRAGMTREPGRYRTLEGAMRAAAAAGDAAAEQRYRRELDALTSPPGRGSSGG